MYGRSPRCVRCPLSPSLSPLLDLKSRVPSAAATCCDEACRKLLNHQILWWLVIGVCQDRSLMEDYPPSMQGLTRICFHHQMSWWLYDHSLIEATRWASVAVRCDSLLAPPDIVAIIVGDGYDHAFIEHGPRRLQSHSDVSDMITTQMWVWSRFSNDAITRESWTPRSSTAIRFTHKPWPKPLYPCQEFTIQPVQFKESTCTLRIRPSDVVLNFEPAGARVNAL